MNNCEIAASVYARAVGSSLIQDLIADRHPPSFRLAAEVVTDESGKTADFKVAPDQKSYRVATVAWS